MSSEVLDLFTSLEGGYALRNAAIALNRAFARGDQWTEEDLEALPEGSNPKVLNYTYAVVLKNMTFLIGRQPEKEVLVSEDNPEARAYASFVEKVLYGVYEASRLPRKYIDFAHNCSVAGGQPVVTDWHPTRRLPVITGPQPEDVFGVPLLNGEYGYSQCFVREYETVAGCMKRFGQDLTQYARKNEVGIPVVEVIRYVDPDDQLWFLREGKELTHRRGYGYCNVVYIPNIPVPGDYEGLADVTLIRDPNKLLNELSTMQGDIARLYADPPVVIKGKVAGVNGLEEIPWGPGAKIPVEIDGEVQFLTFPGTGPDFAAQQNEGLAVLQDLSGIPDVAYGRYQASIQSGVALNTQFQPTRLLMALKQTAWSDAFSEVDRIIIDMLRKFVGSEPIDLYGMRPGLQKGQWSPFTVSVSSQDLTEYVRTRFIWPGMLPKDDATESQTLLNRYTSGTISLHSYLEQMGVASPEDEIERIREEKRDPDLHPELQQETPTDTALPAMPVEGSPMPSAAGPSAMVPEGLAPQESNVSDEQLYADISAQSGMTGGM